MVNNQKIVSATKWSTLTTVASKLITPISTMVLARLLAPDAFGVLVTATMVISFAEVFTDAGFQKYLVQHDFADDDSLYKSVNVAFWSNLSLSILFWIVICIFSSQIAELVGNPGYGSVIAISCICIPLEAFSCIQMALYTRNLDFKTLFQVRIVGICIPLVITLPLAYVTHSYWALIVGMICLNISNAVLLTLKSNWKPKLFFRAYILRQMLPFTMWSMVEAITIWATSYIDLFFVGRMLDEHYLGLYRTSMTTVGQITGLITASLTSVLFSSLSRVQNNDDEFKQMFFKFQKIVSILVVPLGFGIYIFRDFITSVLLGSQWTEAAYFIGIWALASSVAIVLAHFSSEVYRAKGKPKLSFFIQLSQIVCIIVAVLYAMPFGFSTLCLFRTLARLELVVANLIMMHIVVNMSFSSMITNVLPAFIAATVMLLVSQFLPIGQSILWDIVSIIAASCTYLAIIMIFKKERQYLFNIKAVLKRY